MFKLSDLYQSILGMLIRFFDNRFQHQEDELVAVIRNELDKAHYQNRLLIEALSNKSDTVKAEELNEELPRAIGQLSWKARANKLTQDSIKRRRELEEEYNASLQNKTDKPQARTVDELEKELGVGAE